MFTFTSMKKKEEIVSIKVFKKSRATLSIISAVEEKTMQEVFDEIVSDRKKRLKIK